jgi:hypothetical protein
MSITKSILKSQSEDDSLSIRPFFFCVALVVLSLLFFDLEYLETVATQLTAAIVLGIYLSILVLFSRCISYKLRAMNFKYCEVLFLHNYNRTCLFVNAYFFPYSPIKSSTNLTFSLLYLVV